jgi:hypothetical protein
VLLKAFKDYVTALSDRIRSRSQAIAQAAGRSVNYLPSSLARKDAIAQQTAAREGIEQGLIGVWSCVEPCLSYFVRRRCAPQRTGAPFIHRPLQLNRSASLWVICGLPCPELLIRFSDGITLPHADAEESSKATERSC